MQAKMPHITHHLKLNNDTNTRHYAAEICNMTKQGDKKTYTAIAQQFHLNYLHTNPEGNHHYQINTTDRFYLNEQYNVIKKLNKAQDIGLKLAAINDRLEFVTNPHFKFLQIANTQNIRDTWQTIRPEILQEYPDLNIMAQNFDQQLKDPHIQQLYQNDNFFNFFFADIFQQKISEYEAQTTHKIIADAVERIAIPIIEKRKISTPHDNKTTILLNAEMDTEHPKFPIKELTTFLGKLPATPGSQQTLKLQYSGVYHVDTDAGIVTQGSLNYTFSIGELYEKTTIININND